MRIFDVLKEAMQLAEETGNKDLADRLLEAEAELKKEMHRLEYERAGADDPASRRFTYEH